MNIKRKSYSLVLGLIFLASPFFVNAQAGTGLDINYNPLAFTAPASLQVEAGTEANNLPWEWRKLTSAYEYSFATAGLYDPSRLLTLKINYQDKNNYLKQIFIYDELAKTWQPLLTTDNPAEQYVTATTNSISGKVIVLYNPEVLSVGTASWYKYKNGLFAASPDFAKGTVLRVYNLNNGKHVDVTINDFGPERDKFPDRVIDLDYVAFSQIASPGAGIVPVRIETVKTVVPATQKLTPQYDSSLNITASSAVIVWENDGRVLWGKNEEKVSPLASLTKLVAMKVFLDTNTDFKKVVTYKYQDEKYNYEYCKPWESARLTVKEGETMTVEDLVYSALVGSANNAVETLVRASGLSRDEFIIKMNKTVKAWGALDTFFIEPTGLSPDNVSSPADYAIITKELFDDPLLRSISVTPKYSFKTINTKKSHTLYNTNRLLKSGSYPIIGSKTGYLDEAGYCLMTRVQTKAGNLIAINFGSQSKAANFSDNEQLIRYGLHLMAK